MKAIKLKVGKISKGASLAKIKWDQAKHKRDQNTGQFLHKPGSDEFKAETYGPGKTSGVKNDDIVKLHVTANPKKPGSMAATDFAKYQDGMTVADFKAAVGSGPKANEHLGHDVKKGFITIHAPTQLAGQGISTAPPTSKPYMPAVAATAPQPAAAPTGAAGAQPGAPAPKPPAASPAAPAPAPAAAAPAQKNFLTTPTGQQFGSGAPATTLKKSDYLITSKTKGIKDADIIKMQVAYNPKKAGSKANADFAQYKDGMMVGDFHGAVGGKTKGMEHIGHDVKKGFITVHNGTDLADMEKGVLSAGTLAAQMKMDDKKLNTITSNPFTPGKNHDDFEIAAKQMGLVTPSMAAGVTPGPAAAAAPKVKTIADLANDDVIVSQFGTEYKVSAFKKYNDAAAIKGFDAKLASGEWTIKAKAAPPVPKSMAGPEPLAKPGQVSSFEMKEDDIVETWLGNKYTVVDYHNKHYPTYSKEEFADIMSDKAMDGSVSIYAKGTVGPPPVKPVAPPAPAKAVVKTTPAGWADDTVIAPGITGGGTQYTVAEYKTKLSKVITNATPEKVDKYIDDNIADGNLKVISAGSATATVPVAAKPAAVTTLNDADTVSVYYAKSGTTSADKYTVAQYKAMTGLKDNAEVQKLIDNQKLKVIAIAGGVTGGKVVTKLSDIPEADYDKWSVTTIAASNPYVSGTNEYKKYYNIDATGGGTKTKTLEKYFQSTTLTNAQQKTALQQMVDDGHVKFVSPEQKAIIEAQKAKFTATKAAEDAAAAQAKLAGASASHKLHIASVNLKADWHNDPKWGKVQGAQDPKTLMHSDTVKTKDTIALKYHSPAEDAVKSYTDGGYGDMNSTLRNYGYDNLAPGQKKHVAILDKLTNAQTTQEDVVMWRGIQSSTNSPKNMNNIPPPFEFPDLGYASLSFNPSVSAGFGGYSTHGGEQRRTVFRVRVPKGTKAAFIGRRSKEEDAMQDEAEIILARGSKFKYVSTTRDVNLSGYYNKIDVIEVELVTNAGGNY